MFKRKPKAIFLDGAPATSHPTLDWRWIVTVAAFVCLIVLLVVFVFNRDRAATRDKFLQALEDQDYTRVMDLYVEIQEHASNQDLPAENRKATRLLQVELEDLVGERVKRLLAEVEDGSDLTDEEKESLTQLNFLASMHIVPYLREATEELLDGSITADVWEHLLRNFTDISSTRLIAKELLDQKTELLEKREAFQKVDLLEQGDNWQLTWDKWEALAHDSEGSRFSREYAGFRLLSFQEKEYTNLMALTRQMMAAGQYYSAYQLLESVYEAFPDREEVKQRMEECDRRVPPAVESWNGSVEVLSVKPLIVRPELAFDRSSEATYAAGSLITAKEFQCLLDELYRNDYILISVRQLENWPDRGVDIKVPAGKKPLVLVLERYQYTVLNQVCGSAGRLYLDANGQLTCEAGDQEGRAYSAITLLEDFLDEHPDFAFDGAKALLAFNFQESVFGFTVNPEQVAASQAAWLRVGQEYPEVTEEELKTARDKVAEVFGYLRYHGWDFACSGYVGYNTGELDPAELTQEVDQWLALTAPWLPEVGTFVYPNGSHVYGSEDLLDILLDRGFHVFISEGPKPYHFFESNFLHLDGTAVNGITLGMTGGHLSQILDTSKILDVAARGGE